MKHFIKGIPFILLLALTPYLFFNNPSIAQSIILSAVVALCGFRYFQIDNENPDYISLFKEELESIKKTQKDDMEGMLAKHIELKENYGKATVSTQPIVKSKPKIAW